MPLGRVLLFAAERLGRAMSTGREVAFGAAVSVAVGLAAVFVSEYYGGPAMLYALLLGMALGFLGEGGPAGAGIDFAARTVLRFGVALLGARITADHLLALGPGPVMLVVGGVVATLLSGVLLARLFGLRWDFGVLTGGAVAICGASAALAIATVLPRNRHSESNTVLTIIGVTSLSTVAMVTYPALAGLLGLGEIEAGIFIGGSIHDVAQVVGAGYMISETAGDYATLVKLMRVVMLVPLVLLLSLLLRRHLREGEERPAVLPLFLVAFVLLMVANALGAIPQGVQQGMVSLSGLCLVTAIAALGMKTSLRRLASVGWRPVALIVAETAVIAGVFLLVLTL